LRQKKKAAGPESAAKAADAARQFDLDVGEPTGPDARKNVRRPGSTSVAQRSKQQGQKDQAMAADDLGAPLFAALGVPAPDNRAQCALQMRLIGELLRAAIGGTLELLAARSIAKRELGANATQLQARENNPLKFSPDTDAALGHLLGPTVRGFIAPLEAVREAFGDLRAHQVAILTGIRAALDEVLARFDPAALEPRLADDDLWDKLVPTNRKAKMWEQYTQQYAQILREVEGDFDTLFGRAFLRAYQAQLAELSRASDPNARDGS
jgi:type VI secretion system FHA domain protein